MDNVAGMRLVGGDQCREAGHWRSGTLAAAGVVANGGRKDVAHGRAVVDVKVVPGAGHEEFVVRNALWVGAVVRFDPDQILVARR